MAIQFSLIMESPLFIAAWAAYFLILFFWVKSNRVPRVLLIAGALLGIASVLESDFFGLLWAFPAIALMFHVIWRSFRTAAPDIAVKQDAPLP
ncbi:MAG: hypothetical protein LBU11_04635 [Zoogloeaceae bacterium]|nr:hypothetical protein [Zoogloeaceae bacterium]